MLQLLELQYYMHINNINDGRIQTRDMSVFFYFPDNIMPADEIQK